MSGFAKYTSKDSYRLKERPSYRRGQGADPIKSFVARSYATYSQNADRIRDARFAKSNELNRDYAVRNKREQMLSEVYMTERDPVKLQGLHGRIKAKMSRSDGALSYALPYAYKTKFNDPRRNKPSFKQRTQTEKSVVGSKSQQSPLVERIQQAIERSGGTGKQYNRTPVPPSPLVDRIQEAIERSGGGRTSNSSMHNRTPVPPSGQPAKKRSPNITRQAETTVMHPNSPITGIAEQYLENAEGKRRGARRQLNMERGPITRQRSRK
jgi:hypothetical protein